MRRIKAQCCRSEDDSSRRASRYLIDGRVYRRPARIGPLLINVRRRWPLNDDTRLKFKTRSIKVSAYTSEFHGAAPFVRKSQRTLVPDKRSSNVVLFFLKNSSAVNVFSCVATYVHKCDKEQSFCV